MGEARGEPGAKLGAGSGAAEWRQGWPLPIISAIGYAAGITYIYSLGLFIEPLQQQFGWSRTEITFGLTIVSALFVVLVPFVGWLVDRWGARRIALPGLVLYCAALAGLSLAGPSIWSWWGLWVFVGLGALCTQASVWTSAVASRFDKSRGLAMAITLCGAGLGSATAPILANQFIAQLGWRNAYVALGGLLVVIALPLAILFFRDAADIAGGRRSDSARSGRAVAGAGIREAMLSGKFIRLAILSLAVVTAMTAVMVHFVPLIIAAGIDRTTAAAAAGVIGLGSVAGRLTGGLLLDRIHGAIIGAIAFSLPILVSLGLLLFDGTPAYAFALAFLLGLSLGGEVDVLAYLTTRYFGLRNFGTLFATLVGLQTLALGIGPVIAGFVYDRTGSYEGLLIGIIPVFVVSTLLVGTLGPYPAEHGGSPPGPGH